MIAGAEDDDVAVGVAAIEPLLFSPSFNREKKLEIPFDDEFALDDVELEDKFDASEVRFNFSDDLEVVTISDDEN